MWEERDTCGRPQDESSQSILTPFHAAPNSQFEFRHSTMTMLSRSALLVRASQQLAARRQLSTAKMHKAKGNWEGVKSKRPIDADDLHVRLFVEFSGCGVYKIPNSLKTHTYISLVADGLSSSLQQGYCRSLVDQYRRNWLRNYAVRCHPSAVQAGVLEIDLTCRRQRVAA